MARVRTGVSGGLSLIWAQLNGFQLYGVGNEIPAQYSSKPLTTPFASVVYFPLIDVIQGGKVYWATFHIDGINQQNEEIENKK